MVKLNSHFQEHFIDLIGNDRLALKTLTYNLIRLELHLKTTWLPHS